MLKLFLVFGRFSSIVDTIILFDIVKKLPKELNI